MRYLLSRDLLNFKIIDVSTLVQCKNPELDHIFVNDLDRVINYKMDGNNLMLQLSNNAGVMYFIKNDD